MVIVISVGSILGVMAAASVLRLVAEYPAESLKFIGAIILSIILLISLFVIVDTYSNDVIDAISMLNMPYKDEISNVLLAIGVVSPFVVPAIVYLNSSDSDKGSIEENNNWLK